MRSFSPWSDESASETPLEPDFEAVPSRNPLHEKMQNVEMMLDQLARVGVAIRQSGRRSRLQKADHRFKPEEFEDLRNHLITVLLARPGFSKEQIDPSKLSEMQERLILGNLKRRNRFLYAQQHSKGLNPDTAGRPSQVQIIDPGGCYPAIDGELVEGKQKSFLLMTEPLRKPIVMPMNPTVITGTSASAVTNSLTLPQALIQVPATSTVLSSTVIDLKYPHPPKMKEGARVFVCPCCCQTLPVTLSEANRWK